MPQVINTSLDRQTTLVQEGRNVPGHGHSNALARAAQASIANFPNRTTVSPADRGRRESIEQQTAMSLGRFLPTFLATAKLWVRADIGVTQVGGAVSQWDDASGNAVSFQQAVGANKPDYVADGGAGYKNKPIVRSLVTTKWLVAAAGQVLAQPITVLAVGSIGTAGGILVGSSDIAALGPSLRRKAASTDLVVNAGAVIPILDEAVDCSAACAMLGVFNGATSLGAVNNWLTGGAAGNAGANATTKWSIGADATGAGAGGSIFELAELAVWDHALTATEKAQLARYVTSRYGMAIT